MFNIELTARSVFLSKENSYKIERAPLADLTFLLKVNGERERVR